MEDNQSTAPQPTGKKPNGFVRFIKGLFMVLISIGIGAGVIFFLAKQKPEFLGLPKDAAQVQAEVDSLVTEVSSLIALPSDEKPTVATITDVEKIKTQAFFQNAENGDKVLIYTNAKKAILYRPSAKKVIEVGAVNINQQPRPDATPAAEGEVESSASPAASATPVATAEASATPKAVNTAPSQVTQ